jgi:hypothetical protein
VKSPGVSVWLVLPALAELLAALVKDPLFE